METLASIPSWVALLCLKSLPVALIAWLGARALRRAPARARHLLWLAALGALALQPVLGAVGPRWAAGERIAEALEAVAPASSRSADLDEAVAASRPRDAIDAPADQGLTPVGETSVRRRAFGTGALRLLGGLYLAGVLAGLSFLLVGALRVRGICRRADRVIPRPLLDLAAALGAAAEIRLSREAAVPFTFGLVQPLVVLPSAALTWSRRRVANALTHELAHVERRDAAAQILARLVSVLYWCLPFVWWMERELRLEAERACDERVVASGAAAPEYAQQLIELARGAARSGALTPALGMSGRKDLPVRVGSLLAPAGQPFRPARVGALVLALLGLGGATATLHSEPRADARWSTPQPADTLPGLLAAAERGDLEAVRRWIARGEDVDLAVPSRGTALIRAATWGHLAVVEELLSAGADPNRSEGRGRRPEGLQRTPLAAAAAQGSLAIVRRLLDAGAAVEAAPEGDGTALMEAAQHGHLDIVELLLDHGADANRRLEGDGNPLIAAVRGGSQPVVRRLLAAGADAAVGVPGDGNPLIAAVERGDRDLVELLLEAGADPYAYVPGDETALTRAAENGRRDLVELMVDRSGS
jgi:ankyrin repeat protein